VLLIALIGAIIGATSAYATVYAGPKTWLQGWDQHGPYDSSSDRWKTNGMGDKNCSGGTGCFSRVTFIDANGRWHVSYTDDSVNTITVEYSAGYTKKPYCQNNSSKVYVATCVYYDYTP
jgi:hypothetical protein